MLYTGLETYINMYFPCRHVCVEICSVMLCSSSLSIQRLHGSWKTVRLCTVVPALGDPRRERPPAVCGHFVNVPTHFKVKLPVISGHLPNADADSHLLVVSTCYNGQCKQMPRFRCHFNQKSLARTQTCDRQISQISVLSSGDYDNACIH